MANTLVSTVGLSYREDNTARMLIPTLQVTQTLTSAIRVQGVQNVGTTYEVIDLASLATDGGPAWFYNRDDTNFVEIGREISAAFEAFLKIPPQCVAFLPGVSDKDLYAKADTAAIDLEYIIWEP